MFFFFTCGTHTFTKPLKGYEHVTVQCQNCGNISAHAFTRWYVASYLRKGSHGGGTDIVSLQGVVHILLHPAYTVLAEAMEGGWVPHLQLLARYQAPT